MDQQKPNRECTAGGHLWVDVYDGAARAGAWCLWCGGASTDPDVLTHGGAWLGTNEPDFRIIIPDRFTRTT